MTENRKKLLKWLGYPALGTLTFLFALHFTFPYERLRERLVHELSKDYDIGIAEISPGWFPGKIDIKGLTVTTRPKRDDEKPRTLAIDEVALSINFLPLITKTISVDVDAALGTGTLEGTITNAGSGLTMDLRTHDLSLENVPGISVVTGGPPIKGPLEAHVKLSLPKHKWAAASGLIELECAGCSFGDGVTKWRPTNKAEQNAFSNEGTTIPRVGLGQFTARIPIAKGVACFEKFEARGGDLTVLLAGGVRFADPFASTQAEMQARIKTSDEFRKAAVQNAFFDAGVKDSEGFATYQARSPLTALRLGPARGALTPMRECDGVAPPPAPPKTDRNAIRAAPPANPIPVGTPARDAEEGGTPAAATPPAPPPPEPAPVVTPSPAPIPEPTPVAPSNPPQGSDLGTPAAPIEVIPPAQPEAAPPPPQPTDQPPAQ